MPEIFKPNRKLAPHELVLAEAVRVPYLAQPETGTTLDEMLDPRYWASVANKLRPRDRIEVWPADNSWFAELAVLAVEPYAVKVHVLRAERFGLPAARAVELPAIAEGYEVKHRGRAGWCVLRLADNEVLAKDMDSRDAATLWLDRHLRVLAA